MNTPTPGQESKPTIAEWIAATNLLRQWIAKNKHDRPGAWDYDKENARLVEESAALIGIEDPWKQ